MSLAFERMRSLPSTLLALIISHAFASDIELRDESSKRTPSPISFSPDQNFDGIDGSWSSFTLRIGEPAQYVRTFASWTSYQTWAVLPQGCNDAADYQDCSNARGWIYDETKSSTFNKIGIFGLSIEENLGYPGNAIYGYDTVGLGGAGEEGPTLKHTVVGGMAWPDFYLGIFGINPKPTNFTSFNDPSTSYMTLLKDQNYIPSVSFGYTAGAIYKYTGEPASLTLGGIDISKFVQNDVVFEFAPDNSRDIVVAIQSITTPSQTDSSPTPTLLLPSPVYAYMDATIAEIWLPIEACKAFESEFGLVYNSTTELYLVNDTLHQQLLNRNPSITFTLGTDLSNGKTTSIKLPYAAFDLTATSPYRYLTEDSLYFPLRRAENDTQYTIGRTFFQEAYIAIDYEAQTFNVSQRSWDQNAEENIVAIPPSTISEGTQYPGVTPSKSSSGISGGIIAVIVVGIAILIAIASIALFFYLRRRRRSRRGERHEKLGSEAGSTHNMAVRNTTAGTSQVNTIYAKAELVGSLPAIHAEGDDERLHSSGGLSSSGPNTPRTPHAYSGSTFLGHMSSALASPIEDYGTHSSSGTHGGSGTGVSAISPTTPRPDPIFEMAGDMPLLREKDGRELSEKEALAHREKVYNGVEPPSATPQEDSSVRRDLPRRVNPGEVITGDTLIGSGWPSGERDFGEHRAFSFEEARSEAAPTYSSEEDLYS